jgi:large subunit ribosomal protein L29
MSIEELGKKEEELKGELMNMRFQKALGRLDSPAKFRSLKRDLARVKTVLREKELREA